VADSAVTGVVSPPLALEREDEGEGLIEQTRARASERLGGLDFLLTVALASSFLAAAIAMAVLLPTERAFSPALAAGLVGAFVLAAHVRFEVGFGFALPTQLALVPMLFLLPARDVPLFVALALVLGALPNHLRGTWHVERVALHLVSSWYAVGPALVLAVAGEPGSDWRHHWLLFVGALGAQLATDLAVSAIRGIGLNVDAVVLLRTMIWPWLVDSALAPLGLLIAYTGSTRPFSFLLAVPLLGLLTFFARERRARIDQALELTHAYRGTALLLGDVVEADDAYTGRHSRDVVSLAVGVAEALELDGNERRRVELTALLHDVGKIRIPADIIGKNGALTRSERTVIETHTVVGQEMLERVGGLLGEIGRLVRSCHERWDGRGYPDGLAGEEIPLVARIVCCCDALSAMTTDRPYRAALPLTEALAELKAQAGRQFDPVVAEALLAVAPRDDLDRPAHAA
jgi:HD-GYP domain-containing protein (c-di-GMP phosphodiesterase class II)